MKTTIEIPEHLFRKTKIHAATNGISLKEVLIQALTALLEGKSNSSNQKDAPSSRKIVGFGDFAKSKQETKKIQKLIDSEFSSINPEDWA